jgi:tetratricopeptide (TPR) repeat protein
MDKNKWASDCYRKGVEAMEKQNWDLAVEMFGMCAKFVPDNLMYRQLLRNSEYKKYNDNKTGAGTFAKSKLLSIRGRIKKARGKEEWDEVDKACEEGLALNPWDTQLNQDLAEAARKREHLEVAKFAMMSAQKSDPNNKPLNIALAEVLEDRGEYDEAAKVWEHICRLDPNDGQARSRLSGCHTKNTLDRGGYEDAKSTQSVAVNRGRGPKPGESMAPGESEETDLKHAIRKEPDRVEHYLKLANHYKKTRKLDQAYETLNTALQVSGNDPGVRELLEDVELARMEANLELAKEAATRDKTDTARNNAAALANEFHKRKLEVVSRRSERYPQDLNLKFELAKLFMHFQKWAQAIPLLQQASKQTRLEPAARVHMGKCFIYDKKLPLAKGQLERGVAVLTHDADPKLFVEAHYLLARVCDELGDKPTAEKHYGEVLVVDYEYKDAKDRLEKLQGGGG